MNKMRTVQLDDGLPAPDYDPIRDAQETADDAAILKRYRITNLVGTGNYARVYRALTSNGKELAIKAINLNKTSENYKQKFLPRELTILRRISHVNICKIHEILQISDRIFIVMQFCSRGTIADLLQRNGALSENLTRYLFVPTMDAVVYLHSHDVAHRDVKVENILLDHEYSPKLTDFSYSINTLESGHQSQSQSHSQSQSQSHQAHAATSAGAINTTTNTTTGTISPKVSVHASPQKQQPVRIVKTEAGGLRRTYLSKSIRLNDTFCGTLPYLSPEMIRQLPYDSKKTDVWSLGVCFYVMLNDRLPFPFSNIKSMVKKQLTKDYKFKANTDVSSSCKEFLSLLLEPDFTRRLTSQEASRMPWMLNGPREKPTNLK